MGDCKWHRCLREPQRERVTYNAAFYRGDDGGYLPSLKGQSGPSNQSDTNANLLPAIYEPRRNRSPQEPRRRAPACEDLALIVNQKLRVANHVYEQDMSYLKMKIGFGFGDRQSILIPPSLQCCRVSLDSRFLFRNQLLKSRIAANRIPDRVNAQKCRDNLGRCRGVRQPLPHCD